MEILRIYSSYCGCIMICSQTGNREALADKFYELKKLPGFSCVNKEKELNRIKEECTNDFINYTKKKDIESIGIETKGPIDITRIFDIDSVRNSGVNIECIKDLTPIPHNGCVKVKRRMDERKFKKRKN